MGPRRYVAQNPADALKQIRLELGPEAVVLSNREVDDGVEIVAIRPEDLASMSGERSVVAPNSEGAPFAALPMPTSPRAASEAPPAARGRGSSAEGGRSASGARQANTRSRAASTETAPIASSATIRPRAPGSSVMARQRRLEEDQPANRPLGSGVNHELVIANVSQRSDRDRRRNPVYPRRSPHARASRWVSATPTSKPRRPRLPVRRRRRLNTPPKRRQHPNTRLRWPLVQAHPIRGKTNPCRATKPRHSNLRATWLK